MPQFGKRIAEKGLYDVELNLVDYIGDGNQQS